MDSAGRMELESIKRDLQSIINELDQISAGVRTEFDGIGNDRCARAISRVADQYRWVKRQLEKID